jgi:hypothetical protein
MTAQGMFAHAEAGYDQALASGRFNLVFSSDLQRFSTPGIKILMPLLHAAGVDMRVIHTDGIAVHAVSLRDIPKRLAPPDDVLNPKTEEVEFSELVRPQSSRSFRDGFESRSGRGCIEAIIGGRSTAAIIGWP